MVAAGGQRRRQRVDDGGIRATSISCGRKRTRWPRCDVPVPSPLRRSWQQRPPTLLSSQHVACHLTTRGGRCLCCCRQGLPQRPHQIPLIQGGKSQPATRYKMY